MIKKSQTAEEAVLKLNEKFMLSELQAKAILEMRLQRLTGLEQEKIHEEMEELKALISQLQMILEDPSVLNKEIVKELQTVRNEYADARRIKH